MHWLVVFLNTTTLDVMLLQCSALDLLAHLNTTGGPGVGVTLTNTALLVRTEEVVIVGLVMVIWFYSCVLFYVR